MNMNTNDYNHAGFGIRLAAMIIDNVVLGVALMPIMMLFFNQKTYTDAEAQAILQTQGITGLIDTEQMLWQQAIVLFVTVFFWTRFAGTPGKRLLGLRVIDEKKGKPPTVMQSVLRYLGYFVSAFPMCLGFFWVLFDEKHQAWHDKIAGTIVIEDKPQRRQHRYNDHQRDNLSSGQSPDGPRSTSGNPGTSGNNDKPSGQDDDTFTA